MNINLGEREREYLIPKFLKKESLKKIEKYQNWMDGGKYVCFSFTQGNSDVKAKKKILIRRAFLFSAKYR